MSGEPGCVKALWAKLLPRYRSSESIIEEYGRWEPPNEADARENYVKTHAHHDVYDMKTPIKDLKEFGDGIVMYFYMLKFTAILFGVLAFVPGLLLTVFNGLGGWYEQADLERTMLGNYGLLTYDGPSTAVNVTTSTLSKRSASTEGAVTALFASSVNGTAAKMGGMNKRSLLVAMSALDLIGVVAFFAYSLFFLWFVRSRSRKADASAVTIKNYSLRVEGLPPDTSAAALREYLTAAVEGEGVEVVQVELCRKVDLLLELVVERGEVVRCLDTAQAVLQRSAEVFPRVPYGLVIDVLYYRYLLVDVTAAIRWQQAAARSNEVVTAFVTFATPDACYRVRDALPRSLVQHWRMPPERKYNNKGFGKAAKKPVALTITPAPEPSDILYENLEYGKAERFIRVALSKTGQYLVLLVGFLLVSLAPAMRIGVATVESSGPSDTECNAACSYRDAAGNYALSDTNRTLYKGCDLRAGTGALPNKLDCEALTVCYECFCRGAINAGYYTEAVYCSRFSSVVAISTCSQMLAVLGVVIANFIIEFAISWLVRQEKHHTRSLEAVGIVRGLFLTQFINTAFSNLVANMYLPGPARVISGSFFSGYIFSGSYSDTTPNWYRDVCRPILISIFITTALVHIKVAFRWWWRRRCLANRYQCLTQKQMEEAYAGHEFELAIKYGQHMYIIFVVLTYSSGMPMAYILAAVHFISCYWVEKFELLKVCKRPLTYSREVALYVSSKLPFAAVWHLALAIWLFSLFGMPESPLFARTFRRSLASSVNAFKSLIPVSSNLTPQLVAWRFTQNSSGHLFIAFMACGGALFIFFTLSTWMAVSRWVGSLLGLVRDSGGGDMDSDAAATRGMPEFAVAVRSQLLVGPTTYAVQQNPAYAHAFVRMEELEWERKEQEMDAAAAGATFPNGAAVPGGPPQSRRKRTAANRLRAKQHAAAAAMAAAGGDVSAAGGLWPYGGGIAGNKVAPEPQATAAASAPTTASKWAQMETDAPPMLGVIPEEREREGQSGARDEGPRPRPSSSAQQSQRSQQSQRRERRRSQEPYGAGAVQEAEVEGSAALAAAVPRVSGGSQTQIRTQGAQGRGEAPQAAGPLGSRQGASPTLAEEPVTVESFRAEAEGTAGLVSGMGSAPGSRQGPLRPRPQMQAVQEGGERQQQQPARVQSPAGLPPPRQVVAASRVTGGVAPGLYPPPQPYGPQTGYMQQSGYPPGPQPLPQDPYNAVQQPYSQVLYRGQAPLFPPQQQPQQQQAQAQGPTRKWAELSLGS